MYIFNSFELYLGVDFLDWWGGIYFTLYETIKHYKIFVLFYIRIKKKWVFWLLHVLFNVLYCHFLYIPVSIQCYFIILLINIFLIATSVGYSFTCLLGMCISSFTKHSNLLLIILIGWFVSIVQLREFFYILLLGTHSANISPSLWVAY